MSKNIEDLAEDVRAHAWAFVTTLTAKGIPHVVTSTLRTEAEQMALYAQGRDPLPTVNMLRSAAGLSPIGSAENGYTVTNADGVKYKSNHQGGRALDVVPSNEQGNPVWPAADDPRWTLIAATGKEQGFKWGGDWTKARDGIDPDLPHYEMT